MTSKESFSRFPLHAAEHVVHDFGCPPLQLCLRLPKPPGLMTSQNACLTSTSQDLRLISRCFCPSCSPAFKPQTLRSLSKSQPEARTPSPKQKPTAGCHPKQLGSRRNSSMLWDMRRTARYRRAGKVRHTCTYRVKSSGLGGLWP